jgi:hypothetical protein
LRRNPGLASSDVLRRTALAIRVRYVSCPSEPSALTAHGRAPRGTEAAPAGAGPSPLGGGEGPAGTTYVVGATTTDERYEICIVGDAIVARRRIPWCEEFDALG